ncbi:MAG: DUF559 domain-containing protein [Hamadaea sp.]|uniref:type IV toxin-antitoxin system AbiEi family antitoxin domain-containing protein n=1 Tax=Hamadaea sp. TaxID=2024425 RepID=UPI0017D16A22|nr:type IV toxin-antitoxin system AbiEi family antitoxin domain-containing protein [Hamadaea sp.]NUR72246.1 DUF559 domain-containing protein [Hamadaea sp.]NUT17677.1 DUF559 domain-containing protein [Hamadaea sp.]
MMWADLVQPFAETQDGLITAEQCHAAGLSRDQVKRLCRSGEWHRIFRGVYRVWVSAATRDDDIRLHIRAALLGTGPQAVVVGSSAAHLFGLPSGQQDLVHLAVPGGNGKPRRIQDAAVIVHQRVLDDAEVTTVDGMRCTTPARTVAGLLLAADRFTAVSVADAALYAGLLAEPDLTLVERMLFRHRGAVAAREWLEQVDGRAESPLETRGRLRCADAGVGPDDLQVSLTDRDGAFLGRVDLYWHRYRLVAEADGAEFHDRPEALYRDRQRQNGLMAAGFTVVRFTWEDVRSRGRLPAMVRAAMGRPL